MYYVLYLYVCMIFCVILLYEHKSILLFLSTHSAQTILAEYNDNSTSLNLYTDLLHRYEYQMVFMKVILYLYLIGLNCIELNIENSFTDLKKLYILNQLQLV